MIAAQRECCSTEFAEWRLIEDGYNKKFFLDSYFMMAHDSVMLTLYYFWRLCGRSA